MKVSLNHVHGGALVLAGSLAGALDFGLMVPENLLPPFRKICGSQTQGARRMIWLLFVTIMAALMRASKGSHDGDMPPLERHEIQVLLAAGLRLLRLDGPSIRTNHLLDDALAEDDDDNSSRRVVAAGEV